MGVDVNKPYEEHESKGRSVLVCWHSLLEAGHRGLFWCLSCLERIHRTVTLQ
jgi:hypothetical protein